MGMLLAYELEKGTERELKSLGAALGHQVKMVSSSNYGEPLGYVAGITGFKKTNGKDTGEKLGSGMLIFCGLDSEAMDQLLAALRERKLQIPLKAVVTPYNKTAPDKAEGLFPLSVVKKEQSEISDRVISIIKADIHGFHGLHKQNSMAFHRGHSFVRMAAGGIRISTGLTLHTAGGESQHITEFLAETLPKFQSQVLMLLPGFQTGIKVQTVLHLGNGGKKKCSGIFFTFFYTAFNGTNGRRTGPGMAVVLTFVLTEKTDFFGKDQILPVQIMKLQDRIIVDK